MHVSSKSIYFFSTLVRLGLCLGLTGCDSQIANFIEGAKRIESIADPSVIPESPDTSTPGTQPDVPTVLTSRMLTEFGGAPVSNGPFKIGSKIVFIGSDSTHGIELWVHDPILLTTQMLKDLYPGTTMSEATGFVESQGLLYFYAKDSSSKFQLWVSDGSAMGTTALTQFTNDAISIYQALFASSTGVLFFADDGIHGNELWRSNGTTIGTALVADINPGAGSSGQTVRAYANGKYFFPADDGVNGIELWSTDGTAIGTSMVKDIESGSDSTSIGAMIAYGTKVIFSAWTSTNGSELWISDGTDAGTLLLKDIRVGTLDSSIQNLKVRSGKVFFAARDGSYRQLWSTDGTGAGTVKASTAILPYPYNFGFAGDYLFFSGTKSAPVQVGLFALNVTNMVESFIATTTTSDDTSSILEMGGFAYLGCSTVGEGVEIRKVNLSNLAFATLKDINPGTSGVVGAYGSTLRSLDASRMIFKAIDPTYGLEWWISDGTSSGTTILKDISPGVAATQFGGFYNDTSLGKVFFHSTPYNGVAELWQSDGTPSGTKKVIDSPRTYGFSYYGPIDIKSVLNNKLIVKAYESGAESLWTHDLTTEISERLTATIGFAGTSSIWHLHHFFEYGAKLFFNINNSSSGEVLASTDGTQSGTGITIDTYPSGSSMLGEILFLGKEASQFYFASYDPTNGNELWKSDGTGSGTSFVKNITSGVSSTLFCSGEGAYVNGKMLLCLSDSLKGFELWTTDGTAGGTSLVKDINPVAANSGISYSIGLKGAILNNNLYFAANDGTAGVELWKTDGTTVGTSILKDLNVGAGSSQPIQIEKVGNKIVFLANDGNSGNEIWVSDGTSGGTVLLKDITSGAGSTTFSNFYLMNSIPEKLLFYADDGVHGPEPWITDGTSVGTVLIKDVKTGSLGSQSSASYGRFSIENGVAYFLADDGVRGSEIWKTDGSALGTELYFEGNVGPASSPITQILVSGTKLFYIGTSPHGTSELFKVGP